MTGEAHAGKGISFSLFLFPEHTGSRQGHCLPAAAGRLQKPLPEKARQFKHDARYNAYCRQHG